MSAKLIKCKACGAEIAKSTRSCPQCGAKNKKPVFKKWWFWAVILIFLIASCSAGGSDEATESDIPSAATSKEAATSEPASTEIQGIYHVGDTLQDGDLKITYISSGEYVETNDYLQPEPGYKYIYLQFAFENTADHGDEYVSSYDFECYADGFAAEQYYGGEEDLSATLSAGRSTTGYIYFTIPIDATEIDVEYETNFFT